MHFPGKKRITSSIIGGYFLGRAWESSAKAMLVVLPALTLIRVEQISRVVHGLLSLDILAWIFVAAVSALPMAIGTSVALSTATQIYGYLTNKIWEDVSVMGLNPKELFRIILIPPLLFSVICLAVSWELAPRANHQVLSGNFVREDSLENLFDGLMLRNKDSFFFSGFACETSRDRAPFYFVFSQNGSTAILAASDIEFGFDETGNIDCTLGPGMAVGVLPNDLDLRPSLAFGFGHIKVPLQGFIPISLATWRPETRPLHRLSSDLKMIYQIGKDKRTQNFFKFELAWRIAISIFAFVASLHLLQIAIFLKFNPNHFPRFAIIVLFGDLIFSFGSRGLAGSHLWLSFCFLALFLFWVPALIFVADGKSR